MYIHINICIPVCLHTSYKQIDLHKYVYIYVIMSKYVHTYML